MSAPNYTELRAKSALDLAVARACGPARLGRQLGITRQAVEQWDMCPADRVLTVEELTGVSRHDLRPDLYPEDDRD